MITSKQLQSAYVDLYEVLREYIWPSYVVNSLADFEISVYKAFPDLDEVRSNYSKLKYECLRFITDDIELQTEFDNFYDVLNSSTILYHKLNNRIEGDDLK